MIVSRPAATNPAGGRSPHRSPVSATLVPPRVPAEQHSALRPITRVGTLHLEVRRPATGVVVVSMRGEVDLASVPRLTELIRQRMTAATLNTVVLDLSQVGFVSSCGLELLLHAQRRAEHRGIELSLISCPALDRILRVTDLADRFRQYRDVSEALAVACR